ncbi:ankyrin-1-like isoform X1 [Trichogramma pretiosum]|uniref:ankyrin-1-like isoform X1 n=1 Tax=Trichogramma pretiosum TaxID=7493 RepID=UPI0006C9AAE2|nr:ankyrin-1-like isoform X1 [Trichogramma pretiosum]
MASFEDKSDICSSGVGESQIEPKIRLEQLNYLRQSVNWKFAANRLKYYDNFYNIVSNWKGPHPNLQEIIKPKNIDKLLSDLIKNKKIDASKIKRIIEFVARCGYKDEPKVDKDGKPALRRTTAVHHAAVSKHLKVSERKAILRELFEIYNRFDANYTDVKSEVTHFHIACKFGCNKVIKRFLELGQDPDLVAKNQSVDPPLLLATKRAKATVIKLLLKHGANPNLTDKYGSTPLHIISWKYGDADLAKTFFDINDDVERTLDINARDKFGNTPLQVALANDHWKLAESLLSRGGDLNLNFCDEMGRTPLHNICMRNDRLAKWLLGLSGDLRQPVQVNINAQDKTGNTPLHYALENNLSDTAEWLLSKGADVNLANEEGSTPLHNVCKGERVSFLKSFLKNAEEVNQSVRLDARDKLGNAPLHLALRFNKDPEVPELLLKKGADANLANEEGSTPLHIICKRERVSFLKSFLKNAEEVNQSVRLDARDKFGNAPLHLALQFNADPEVPEFLLKKGADVNLANEEGSTPLHIICEKESVSRLKLFLKNAEEVNQSVQIDAWNNEGNTPLHLAIKCNTDKKVSELLLQTGADPNSANEKGLTPLHIICKWKGANLLTMFFNINKKLDRTVQVDAQDNEGNTPLHSVTLSGNEKKIEFLLRKGANPNLANEDGTTPLHIICNRRVFDDDLAGLFFEVNDKLNQPVRVDVKDKKGLTPLQRAVMNFRTDTVDLLLDRGADLASFVFPAESHFEEIYDTLEGSLSYDGMILLASGALATVERLERGGYELDRCDALTIMRAFAECRLFEKSSDLEKHWYDDEEFAERAKKKMVKPNLSLYDLVRLQPKQAAKLLTYQDYTELASGKLRFCRVETCAVRLCEIISRGFFRDWALDSFMQLIQYRLPVEICEIIVDQLANQDLHNICLAASIELQKDNEKNTTTTVSKCAEKRLKIA